MPYKWHFLGNRGFFWKILLCKGIFVKINHKDLVAIHVLKCLPVYTACKKFLEFCYLQKIDKDHTLVGPTDG